MMSSFVKSGIYLDHNATTAPSPQVLKKVGEWLAAWGNPSSVHWAGRAPKTLLREARAQVANFIGCNPLEVVFTSSGTESNNLIVKGVFDELHPTGSVKEGRDQFIMSGVEHPALTSAVGDLRRRGARVEVIKVNREGHLDLENLQRLMSERTALVSIMLANNETGTIFPIKKIAKLAHEMGALVHTDATQALGKMLFNVGDLGVDFATLSGHKFYALRGVGILYARKGCSFHSQLLGGGQERARRGGTENILAIASLGEMCLTSKNDLEEAIVRMRTLRDLLETRVLDQVRDVSITALASPRTCNTSSLVVDGIDGETLLMNLDMKGFAVSAGSACSSGSAEPSAVLRAMGLSFAEAQSTLRISLGWNSNEDEVVQFANTLAETVARLRGM